jgi:hypothetical protein
VQGDAGHPDYQGGGPKKNNWKKWRAEEEERHKGSLTPKKGGPPKTYKKTYKKYRAMDNVGGTILFMIRSVTLIPWAFVHHLFVLFDFQFLDFYGSHKDTFYIQRLLWIVYTKRRKKFRTIFLCETNVHRCGDQGDQIGRIFAFWAVAFFWAVFLKTTKVA